MSAAAYPQFTTAASWRVSRGSIPFAHVALRHEGGNVLVDTDLAATPSADSKAHEFNTIQAAEAFVADLLATFAYLDCDVAQT